MPTSCTGESRLADAEKKVPDPPSTFSTLPNGVSTESSATEPTTRTVISVVELWFVNPLHPIRRADADEIQAVAQHEPRGARQHQPGAHQRLRLVQHVRLVIPEMDLPRQLVQVRRHPMRLERARRARDERRIVEQRLD